MEVRRSTLRHQRRKQVVHDSVSPAAATAFCRHEPDYHCVNCDSQTNKFSQAGTSHDGVLICAACERAPAVVTCLADAASLCLVCDAEIHSASSLASRHRRTPILHLPPTGGSDILAEKTCINPIMKDFNKEDGFFPGEEVDQYLDLAELDDLGTEFFPMGSERAVPLNLAMTEEQQQQLQQKHQLDASAYPLVGYSAAINNSASLSSMELSMVPDDAATAINSFSNTSMSLLPGELLAGYHQRRTPLPQFSPGDREARVLRYREKKKARNFEKTIRYASRKAYAEARPRIRGRFARRSHVETDAEKKHCGSAAAEGGYGIVPSFS